MDENNKIVGVVFNLDKNQYDQLIKQGVEKAKASLIATQTTMIFRQDPSNNEIVDFGNYDSSMKETRIKEICSKAIRDGAKDEIASYWNDSPIITDSLRRAANHEEYLSKEKREEELEKVVKKETNNGKKKVATAAIFAAAIVALAAYGHLHKGNKENTESPTIENTIEEDGIMHGYGFYKFDLSSMEDMSEYIDNTKILGEAEIEAQYGIKGVAQKDRSALRLSVLEKFNNEITLVDGETKQLGGLTIEQLIALDAYSNSNIYEAEDYIKNFGLYNFRNIADDFQQATLTAGAYLADSNVDGSALADIFLDEAVKENYLKQLDYRDRILNAETKEEQKKIVKEYVEFLSDCSINQASDEYLDYDQHPGMAFVTSAIVNSLNYNNIVLDKNVISKTIIIGTEDNQSKLNSICADAQAKLDAAAQLADSLEIYLPENSNIKIDNEKEIELAKQEGREPRLKELHFAELDTVIRELICDQNQINELTDKTLEKEEKLVTKEDQTKILANGVNIQVQLLNNGQGYYKDSHTAVIAEQLEKPGDTVTQTEKEVPITTPEQIQKIEEANPEQTQAAKDNVNKELGTIDNSTPEEQQKVQDQINTDIKQTEQEGINYYNSVVAYYEVHGDVSGIPAELQSAYNNLGADTFNLAKQTGIARYMTNGENKISGGGIVIDSEFQGAEIYNEYQAPVESIDRTTPEVVPNPNPVPVPENPESVQPEIDYIPGFENAEIEGNIIIGDTPIETQSQIVQVVENVPVTEENNVANDDQMSFIDFNAAEAVIATLPSDMTDEEFEQYLASGGLYQDVMEIQSQSETENVKSK